jgi:polyhydroxyalkanoate synthesis regulator phasin
MEEKEFRRLYRRLVERCELSPQEAKKLLQRILTILQNMTGEEAP